MDGAERRIPHRHSSEISEFISTLSFNFIFVSLSDRGTGSETGLKHYLIITLAVICILIVGALLVLLLRRPTFCKKQGRSRTSSGAGGGNFNPNLLRGCDDNSVSPIPAPLDSLPVAMNTGIFVPGGSYDWQECRFQESTLTGTSVFK